MEYKVVDSLGCCRELSTFQIDDRITRKLLETIEVEHNLRLVATGTPRLQPRPATPTPSVAGRAA